METKGIIGFESSLPSGDHTNPADCAHRFGQFVAPLGRVHRGSVLWIHPGRKFASIHFQSRHPHHVFFLGKPCSQTNTTDRIAREGPCAERDRRNPAACSHRINDFVASWRLLHQGWLAIGKYLAEIQQLALMTKFCLPSCHTMARARHEQRCLSLWIERVVPRCLSLGDGLSINLLGK